MKLIFQIPEVYTFNKGGQTRVSARYKLHEADLEVIPANSMRKLCTATILDDMSKTDVFHHQDRYFIKVNHSDLSVPVPCSGDHPLLSQLAARYEEEFNNGATPYPNRNGIKLDKFRKHSFSFLTSLRAMLENSLKTNRANHDDCVAPDEDQQKAESNYLVGFVATEDGIYIEVEEPTVSMSYRYRENDDAEKVPHTSIKSIHPVATLCVINGKPYSDDSILNMYSDYQNYISAMADIYNISYHMYAKEFLNPEKDILDYHESHIIRGKSQFLPAVNYLRVVNTSMHALEQIKFACRGNEEKVDEIKDLLLEVNELFDKGVTVNTLPSIEPIMAKVINYIEKSIADGLWDDYGMNIKEIHKNAMEKLKSRPQIINIADLRM